ncbi:pectate lyase-like adhesive domain-containing protein [Lactobacillus crispatus]|uniref:pectate lyase-like adhesive domain-containing protein n=1 Tax=Lactobacillus crispatus TaxID=47770 RepID=UPI0018AA58E1|nr:pectate lyase-like adhesive domain-containing protein [Lactobacillus crispatus]
MHSHFRGENHQHFSLRKLTIGVASVLIGTTFMIFGGHAVHADDLSRGAGHENSSVVQTQNSQESEKIEVADKASNQKQNVSASQVERTNANNKTVVDQASSTTTNVIKTDKSSNINTIDTVESKANGNNTVVDNTTKTSSTKTLQNQQADHYNTPVDVTDWKSFTSALRNKDVDAIILNNDINATGNTDELKLDSAANNWQDWNIARKLTITSKDATRRNTINFGDHFISFCDPNHYWKVGQKEYTPWDITLKDINITNTNKNYSPFFFNNEAVRIAQKDKITYDNVEQTGDMLLRSEQVNVGLKGNVIINSTLHNGAYNAIYARSVDIDPNANVVMNVSDTSDSWFLHGDAAIKIVGDGDNNVAVNVGEGAKLQINPNHAVRNTKGILIEGNGDVILNKNANVEMNMGSGNTTAIWGARNLILNEGATLNIKTLQDNNGQVAWGDNNNGHHVSPISIGTNKVSGADNTLEVKKGATLKIVRENSGLPAIDGLISFGSYSTNAYSKQNLLVDEGATLDLQDAAQSDWHEYGDKLAGYLGDDQDLYTTGLISMYGVDATDKVQFGNAKYVNLQRTGNQHGILLRLEGGSSIGGNSVVIDAKGMPLKQWIAGNHSKNADYSWNLDYLRTENKWGDYSYNYNGKNQSRWDQNIDQRKDGITFDRSNGAVKFTDGKSLVYGHSDFNNKFNWWAPQRLSFGTIYAIPKASVEDVDALITHVNANTKVSPSLSTNNISFTWKDTDGNITKAPKSYQVTWVVDPNTTTITADNSFDRTGVVEITINGEVQEVVVPVKVLGATVKNNGAKVNQNDESTLPEASHFANTTAVDRFGISGIDWIEKPAMDKPTVQSFGKVAVHYTDGTVQVIDPYVDVREVQDGRDYKDNAKLYRNIVITSKVTNAEGNVQLIKIVKSYYKIKYIDYAYPVGNKNREVYTSWKLDKEFEES